MDFHKSGTKGRNILTKYTDTCTNHVDTKALADEQLEALESDLEFSKVRAIGKCDACKNWTRHGRMNAGVCEYSLRSTSEGAGCSLLFLPRQLSQVV